MMKLKKLENKLNNNANKVSFLKYVSGKDYLLKHILLIVRKNFKIHISDDDAKALLSKFITKEVDKELANRLQDICKSS